MRLVLKNFKCWENAEFDIFENGITLLSGNSGCGKTSILQAIYFVLYDKGTKLVRIGTSSCRVELDGFGMHIVRTKKPNRLVVDNKYEDEVGQAMIDRKFGRNFNVVSYIEQDSFKSVVYMTPASRLEFMENFAFESVDIERVKANLKCVARQSEDARLKAQTELEFHMRIHDTLHRPEPVLPPTAERPLRESVNLNSTEMDRLTALKLKLKTDLADVEIRSREAIHTRETLTRLQTEIAELEQRVADTAYCGNEEYIRLAAMLKKSADAREYVDTKKKYEEILQKYKSLKSSEESVYKTRVEQLRSQLWTGLSKDKTRTALADARQQVEVNREYSALAARVKTLQHVADEYKTLLPMSGSLATCPGCACSVSIVDSTTLLLSSQRDESAVLRVQTLRPQYSEYSEALQRLRSLEYREVDLTSLDAYFLENDNRERQLAALGTFSASPTLASIFREGKDIKQRLDQFTDVDTALDSDEVVLRDRLSEERSRKNVVDMLLEQIADKKRQCPTVSTDVSDETRLGELRAQITDVEDRICVLYNLSKTQMDIEKAWHEYDVFVAAESEYNEAATRVEQARSALRKTEIHYENVQRLKEIVSLSESECLASTVNTINIHAQQFIDAFFLGNPMSAQLVTFKEVKSGRTTTSKPQIDLKIEYKGQDTDLSSLSGGERARLSLAFTLALAEIYNHPLLMLDESISSLDYESTVDVVQAIKEILADKTVLIVSHQANTGIFDHVVNF